MGALVSDFPSLPLDVHPQRAQIYAGVYEDLAAIGIPVPATPADAITRAALLAHLQAQAGALIKAELAGDPEGVFAGAPDDATLAARFPQEYNPGARRLPGSSQTGYKTMAGSTASGLVCQTNPGNANPLFLALTGLAGAGLIRFRAGTTTVALRGVVMGIDTVNSDTSMTMSVPLPAVPVVGDIFDIGINSVGARLPGRLGVVLRRFPFSPNVLTAADITSAKV